MKKKIWEFQRFHKNPKPLRRSAKTKSDTLLTR